MRVGNFKIRWIYQGDQTNCLILSEKNQVVIQSVVKRFHKDIPNKRYARKEAFRRAMNKAVIKNLIPKEIRTEMWNTFRETINQPVKQAISTN